MGAYLSKPVTETFPTDETSGKLSYGASSMQGWRVSQEDAHCCLLNYDEETALFGVFDGHGGAEVAKYTAAHLPDFLKTIKAYQEKDFESALKEAFVDFDKTLIEDSVRKQLKALANSDDEDENVNGEDEEDADNNLSNLKEEAKIPIQELLFKYAKERLSKIKKANKDAEKANEEGEEEAEENDNSNENSKEAKASVNGTNGKECNSNHEEDKLLETEESAPVKTNGEAAESSVPGPSSSTSGQSDENESQSEIEVAAGSSGTSGSSKRKAAKPKKQPESDDDDDEEEEEELDSEGKPKVKASALMKLLSDDFDSEDDDDSNDEDADLDSDSENDEDDDDDEEEDEEDEDEEESDDEAEDMDVGFAQHLMKPVGEVPGKDSGCTAVMAVLHKHQLFVANAGDSRCVLSRAGKAIEMSFDHKPESEIEFARIKKAGGYVNADGRVNGGLNLSRAIGDHSYKENKELDMREQMITALPDIEKIEITPEDEFMIIACDGIWNSMTSQEAVDFVQKRISKEAKLSEICDELFHRCLAGNSSGDGTGCDNMTCVIVRFDENIQSKQNGSASSENNNKRSIDETENGDLIETDESKNAKKLCNRDSP